MDDYIDTRAGATHSGRVAQIGDASFRARSQEIPDSAEIPTHQAHAMATIEREGSGAATKTTGATGNQEVQGVAPCCVAIVTLMLGGNACGGDRGR